MNREIYLTYDQWERIHKKRIRTRIKKIAKEWLYRFLIDLSEQGRHELRRRNSWKRNPGAGAVLLPIPEMLRQ